MAGNTRSELARVVDDLLLQGASGALLSTVALALVAVFAALRAVASWAHARAFVAYELHADSLEVDWVAAWLASRPEAAASGAKQVRPRAAPSKPAAGAGTAKHEC